MQAEHILILAICGLGVIHGFSLGAYLLINPGARSLSGKLLGVLLLIFGLRISKSIFLYYTPDLSFQLITLGLTLILCFGPLFYFYARSLLLPNFRLNPRHLLHGVPFLLFLILNLSGILNRNFYAYFGIFFIYLHFIAYIIMSFFWHKRQMSSQNADRHQKLIQWIDLIHLGMAVVWISYFMFLLDEIVPYILGPVTYSLVIYPLSFWAILRKVHKPEEKKYQNSRLDNQESLEVIARLEQYIENEAPFLNPDLKLSIVASAIDTKPHILSQAINENFKQNFQQYLNTHRVQVARKVLASADQAHLTIASIAFDSGFNSLSAFNAAFKKETQKTPSQYRKEQSPPQQA